MFVAHIVSHSFFFTPIHRFCKNSSYLPSHGDGERGEDEATEEKGVVAFVVIFKPKMCVRINFRTILTMSHFVYEWMDSCSDSFPCSGSSSNRMLFIIANGLETRSVNGRRTNAQEDMNDRKGGKWSI